MSCRAILEQSVGNGRICLLKAFLVALVRQEQPDSCSQFRTVFLCRQEVSGKGDKHHQVDLHYFMHLGKQVVEWSRSKHLPRSQVLPFNSTLGHCRSRGHTSPWCLLHLVCPVRRHSRTIPLNFQKMIGLWRYLSLSTNWKVKESKHLRFRRLPLGT